MRWLFLSITLSFSQCGGEETEHLDAGWVDCGGEEALVTEMDEPEADDSEAWVDCQTEAALTLPAIDDIDEGWVQCAQPEEWVECDSK